jgi:hypothetical protein
VGNPIASSASSTAVKRIAEKILPECQIFAHCQRGLHRVFLAEIMRRAHQVRPVFATAGKRDACLLLGGSRPASTRSNVDLPEPFSPRITRLSPADKVERDTFEHRFAAALPRQISHRQAASIPPELRRTAHDHTSHARCATKRQISRCSD